MFRVLLRRFSIALFLVALGLASVLFFVRFSQPQQSEALSHTHATSEDHKQCAAKIIGKPLPALSLRTTANAPLPMAVFDVSEPVILIRYLGHTCSHCIEHLLALQQYSDSLKRRKIRVIAFSEDTPEENLTVMHKYEFDSQVFTLASDPINASARTLGALYTETDGTITELHVALVVKRGIVTFAHYDTAPMADIAALIAQAQ
ncbi:MAG: redoxin domain-containing protein [Bacteroidota bacterium]|nr:redoxin domain-containing protein [Candidatus Kapabacteria bacterium]MDW8220520.1 redoxin domain-containing protein [Bacteroidota bacterium]